MSSLADGGDRDDRAGIDCRDVAAGAGVVVSARFFLNSFLTDVLSDFTALRISLFNYNIKFRVLSIWERWLTL